MGEATESARGADGASPDEGAARARLSRGATLGRYVVLEEVGAGAMGAVYAAYDPELDRKVAVKVVREDDGQGSANHAGQTRLLREAQAMARIGHPNVIQVFDVGTYGEAVYIAMEFIEGESLHRWQRERTPPEVLQAYAQAARGLEHAHRAGVVHRDFKPDNCLVDAAGRVRVIDFGIARHRPTAEEADFAGARGPRAGALDADPATSPTAATEPLETNLGMLVGTPAYMSPEQFAGAPADAKSDQFAFCVALYEALYGQRPFRGGNVLQLMNAVSSAALPAPPRRPGVPDSARAAVLRGLERDPEARHPTMAALEALLSPEREPRGTRDRWLAVALGAVALGAVGVAARGVGDGEVCRDLEAHLDGVWDASRRAEILPRLRDPEGVAGQLDAYASGWVAAREDACRATRVRREQTAEVQELRVACLDHRLDALRAVTDVLREGGPEVASRAAQVVGDLPRLAPCADLERLRAEAEHRPPPEIADRVAEAERRRLSVEAVRETGQYAAALAQADALMSEVEALRYLPLQAEVRLLRSRAALGLGRLDDAKRDLFEAARLAYEGGDPHVEAEAWVDLVFVVGTKLRNRRAGRRWAGFAEAAVGRAGGAPLLAGRLRYYEGLLASAEGREIEALSLYDQAERLHRAALPEGHWRFGVLASARAAALRRSGRHEEARAAYELALSLLRSSLGDAHPHVAMVFGNLAVVLRESGDLAAAREAYEETLVLKRATLGPRHPSLAFTLVNLANLERRAGRFDRAEALLTEARALRVEALGAEHPLTVSVLAYEAELSLDRREFDRGLASYRTVFELVGRSDDAFAEAVAENNFAWALCRAGRYEEAEARARHALAVFLEREVEPTHLAFPRTVLGLAFVEQGREEEAVGPLRLALETRAAARSDPEDVGATAYALGRALFESGRDRPRGYALVEEALTHFTNAAAAGAWGRERATAWLAAHARPPVEVTAR